MKSKSAVLKRRELDFDFRNASWGMTKSDVKYSEGIQPHSESENYVTYREKVMGLDAVIGFHFNDGYLVRAGYAFREFRGDEADYIEEYEKVKGMLTSVYGEPEVDENLREKTSLCDSQTPSCDDLDDRDTIMLLSQWLTGRSIVRLILMGCNEGCDFGVLYITRDHDDSVK
ncbi:MAG: hypothetical protein RIG61_11600 [Deltaproteobacteria bacterium]